VNVKTQPYCIDRKQNSGGAPPVARRLPVGEFGTQHVQRIASLLSVARIETDKPPSSNAMKTTGRNKAGPLSATSLSAGHVPASQVPPSPAAPEPPPRKRKRKSTAPRGPRIADPAVAAIYAEAKTKVIAYRSAKASGKILHTILTKRLAQLTPLDKEKLFDALKPIVTPALPIPPTV
jgi:ribosomal protein L25 (general stress protein Ctc)